MPTYRLSYPATVMVSIEAGSEEEARNTYAGIIDDYMDGVDLEIYGPGADERVYFDPGPNGTEADPKLIEVCNVEEV